MKLSKNKILHKLRDKIQRGQVNEENLEETIQWYDKQIEKNPKDTGLYYAKATLLAKEGHYEKSIATLNKIIELDPDNEKVWYIKANTLYGLQKYDEAIECFNKILEFTENDEKVWFHKGEALLQLERYREAIECFDNAIRLDRNFTEAWLGRGHALRMLRSLDFGDNLDTLDRERMVELENALESYTVVNNLNPDCEEAWHGKGSVLYTLQRYDEALPCYDRCIQINPSFIKGWYDRGKTLRKLDREEEARQSFETVVGYAQDDVIIEDAEAICARANAFYELGRYGEALNCFNKILEKYPHNHYALEGKGAMLEMLGRNEEALGCYKDAIDMSSNKISTWYRLGNLLSDAGDYDAAIESYNEAVQLALGFEDAWYRIGELLKMQNDYKKAQECFSWIIKINPENIKAKEALLTLSDYNENNFNDSSILGNSSQNKTQRLEPCKPIREQIKKSVKIFEDSPSYKESIENGGYSEEELEIESLSNLEELIKQGIEPQVENLPTIHEDIEWHNNQDNVAQEKNYSDLYDDIYADLDELERLLDEKTVLSDTYGSKDNGESENEVSIDKLIIIGKTHLENKEFEKALNYFDRALELDPNNLDAWIAKGDVFLMMGKIEGASSCYKKNIAYPLIPINIDGNKESLMQKSSNKKWMDTLISFLENIYQISEIGGEPNFECPNCGSKIDLDNKICPSCDITFLEEEFIKSSKDTEHDLNLFDRLQCFLSTKLPTFIHLDRTNGVIRFLEKRKDDNTGKFNYIIVKGKIKKSSKD